MTRLIRNSQQQQKLKAEASLALLPSQKALLRERDRLIRVRIDGEEQQITKGEAVLQKQFQTALGGSTHAQNHIARNLAQAERQAERMAAAEVEQGHAHKDLAAKILLDWIASGKDQKLCTPHPDDFTVTEGVGYKFKGPLNKNELDDLLKNCAERDLFYGQAKLEERLATRQEWSRAEGNLEKSPDACARLMSDLIDMGLPERFRLTSADRFNLERKYDAMSKRELLKHMHAAWRKIGKPLRRGMRMPTIDYIKHMASAFGETFTLMHRQESVGRPMSEKEIATELTQQMDRAPPPFQGRAHNA